MGENDGYLSSLHPVDNGLMEHWLAERDARQAGERYQAGLIARCPHKVIFQTKWGKWQQCTSCGAESMHGEMISRRVPFANLSYVKGATYLDVSEETILARRSPPEVPEVQR